MGCASSVVPQGQQPRARPAARAGRAKRKLNALVPAPPARPSPAAGGPRAGLVAASAPGPARPAGPAGPASYEELCVAFLQAVKRGDVARMEAAAQLAVQLTPAPQSLVNVRGMWESTPLVYAAQYAQAAAAHWLLARGADVLARNERGVTALLLASLEGLTDVCAEILSVAALMGGGDLGAHVDEQVGVVYNAAADANVRLSPLLAASMNGHAAVAALLLAHGADPDRPVAASPAGGGARQFALLLAAKHGHAAVLALLLAHAADCGARDAAGSHALLLACEARREDCALLLLRHEPAAAKEAAAEAKEAAAEPKEAAAEPKEDARSVWLQPNRHGLTALHAAAAHGLLEAAAALLALARAEGRRADGGRAFLDAASATRGETALLVACRKRQPEAARLLLAAGADPARADRGGTTPMHVLERAGQAELLALCRAARPRDAARDAGAAAARGDGDSQGARVAAHGGGDAVAAAVAAGDAASPLEDEGRAGGRREPQERAAGPPAEAPAAGGGAAAADSSETPEPAGTRAGVPGGLGGLAGDAEERGGARRTEAETDGGAAAERPSSSASASPKEHAKKAGRRKRRDQADATAACSSSSAPSPSPSPPRHQRRHRPKAPSAGDDDEPAAAQAAARARARE